MFSNSYENKIMDVERTQFHLATTAELLLVAQQQTQLQYNGTSAEHAAEARSTGRDVAERRCGEPSHNKYCSGREDFIPTCRVWLCAQRSDHNAVCPTQQWQIKAGRIKVHLDADCTCPVDIYYARNCLFTAGRWFTSSTFLYTGNARTDKPLLPHGYHLHRSKRFRSQTSKRLPGWSVWLDAFH